MNDREPMPMSQSLRLDAGWTHEIPTTESTFTALMMIGSVLGAVLSTIYCRSFLESQSAMAMGMIGAVGGALLAGLVAPTWVAFFKRDSHTESLRR